MPGHSRGILLLNPDFRDILSAFAEERVDFIVVGAYALAAHGLPRATGDIDLWVRPAAQNSRRIWRAFEKFGAPMKGLERNDFEKEDLIVQIGRPPRRIDVMTSVSDLDYDAAWKNRKIIEIEGVTIAVLGKSDFIKNKKAVGRAQDIADVKRLESLDEEDD
jgi:hypothetical protein